MQIRYPLSKHLAEVGSLVQKSRILVWAVISTALCAYLYCPAAEFLPAHVVDLMVVFTSAAKTGAGGESTIRSQIDLALVEANSVLQLSRVNMRLRLIHVAEANYTESGKVTNDLARLSNPSDGFLDDVMILRQNYGADVVCLITEVGVDLWFSGLQGPSADKAFSIVQRRYLKGAYFFPVALSFNFGCQLERPYADSVAAFPFSYGHTFNTPHLRRVSTVDAFDGRRLPYFSNPLVIIDGMPAGVPAGLAGAADNARTLNLTTPLVAAFRGTANTTTPPTIRIVEPFGPAPFSLTVVGGTNLEVQVEASDADGVVSQVNFIDGDRDELPRQILGTRTNAPFTFVWTNVTPGHHFLIAEAVDSLGASTRTIEPLAIFAEPPNDSFASATVLTGTNIFTIGTTLSATVQEGEWDWGGSSVWYSWTAPETGTLHLAMPEWISGTVVAVYTGETVSNLNNVAHNVVWEGGWLMAFDAQVIAGTNYHIGVVGSEGRLDRFALQLTFTPSPLPGNTDSGYQQSVKSPVEQDTRISMTNSVIRQGMTVNSPVRVQARSESSICDFTWTPSLADNTGDFVTHSLPPANDLFACRVPLFGSSTAINGTVKGATREEGEPILPSYPTHASVWYTWTAQSDGQATVSLPNAGGTVAVYAGSTLSALLLISDAPTYSAVFYAVAGTPYQIVVSDDSGHEGDFELLLSAEPPAPRFDSTALSQLADGRIRLRIAGTNGQSFVLQASTDLNTWQNLTIDTFQREGFVHYVDNDAVNIDRRFYRVLPLSALFIPQQLEVLPQTHVPEEGFGLIITGPSGLPFVLEGSTDLVNWSELLRTQVIGDSATFSDVTAGSSPARFYRVFVLR